MPDPQQNDGHPTPAGGVAEASPPGRPAPSAPIDYETLGLRLRTVTPGTAAGIGLDDLAQLPSTDAPVRITVFDYCPEQVQFQEVSDIKDFLLHHRPEWSVVRWINVDGLTNMGVIRALSEKYELHPLAIEDLLHIPQRPKVDTYPAADGRRARLFIIVQMLEMVGERLEADQVSIFVGHKTVITFQQKPGDVWDPIRQRIKTAGSRIRLNDASFLVYTLLDETIDQCFPILEDYGDRLEELDDLVLARPDPATIHEVHRLKRELLMLRRAVWPMREVVNNLQREPHECFSDTTRTYLRDVYDHTVQIIDLVETYRELATGLTETYMTAMSNRMNEIMKVLTIMGTIFIPLTFLAGVYGMNFHYLPELNWRFAYPLFWVICLVVAVSMLVWFRRKKWI